MEKKQIISEIITAVETANQYNGHATSTEGLAKKLARKSIAVLEAELTNAQRSLKEAKRDYLLDEYEASDACKQLERKAMEEREALLAYTRQYLENVVANVLGKMWAIDRFSNTHCYIGLKETDPSVNRVLKFGHRFELYYDNTYEYDRTTHDYHKVFKFEANCGTMGNFKIEDADAMREFYIGVGKFLSDGRVVDGLKAELKRMADQFELISTQCKKAEEAYVSSRM